MRRRRPKPRERRQAVRREEEGEGRLLQGCLLLPVRRLARLLHLGYSSRHLPARACVARRRAAGGRRHAGLQQLHKVGQAAWLARKLERADDAPPVAWRVFAEPTSEPLAVSIGNPQVCAGAGCNEAVLAPCAATTAPPKAEWGAKWCARAPAGRSTPARSSEILLHGILQRHVGREGETTRRRSAASSSVKWSSGRWALQYTCNTLQAPGPP